MGIFYPDESTGYNINTILATMASSMDTAIGPYVGEQKLTIAPSGGDITLAAGYTAADDLSVSQQGKIIILEGTLRRTAGNFTNSPETLFTLPSTVRPRAFRRLVHPLFASGVTVGTMITNISSGGVVSGYANGGSADTIYFCHSWKIA